MSPAEFDRFARTYEQDLQKSLAATGEGREFYAQTRIDWTAQCVARLGQPVKRILDYGCGDGANAPMLATHFHAEYVLGVDVSGESIGVARSANSSDDRLHFLSISAWTPDGAVDLAFTKRSLPPHSARGEACQPAGNSARTQARRTIRILGEQSLDPGTQYVMSQCVFDENAIKISPRAAKAMLHRASFAVVRSDSLFYFPRQLSFLRPAEAWLRALPLGGQYLMLCRSAP